VQRIVEYAATSEQGHTIVVIGPLHLERRSQYHLFLGVVARVEREIITFGRE
jgi:hypothetical protein